MRQLSYAAEQVMRYDPDRFMTAILAPETKRENLCALYAFNIEIAKIGEVVSEPLIGQMRLQWWRDTLDRLYAGTPVAHGVAQPLGDAISASTLDRALFDRLIDAREIDLDKVPPADFAAMLSYAENAGGPLTALAVQIAGGQGAQTVSQAALGVGTAWTLIGLLRAVPFHARQHRLYLPADRLEAAGVAIDRLFDLKPGPALQPIVRDIAEYAASLLRTAKGAIRVIPQGQRSPLLLAELARLYLADLKQARWDPFALEARPKRNFIFANLVLRAWVGRY